MNKADVENIEKILGYSFRNKELLIRAFTHSSFANEHKHEECYERLEFLGDAALNFIVGLYLYETFPSFAEGKLSKLRAGTVDKKTVAEVVDELGLLRYMRIGRGSAGLLDGQSVKVKCDLFEAILGATIIDADEDLTAAKKIVGRFLEDKIKLNSSDYKSKVLEHCASQGKKAIFRVVKEGDSTAERFEIALLIDDQEVSVGVGENKKAAENLASKRFLDTL